MNTERLEGLVQRVRSIENSTDRDAALELVQAVMDLHAGSIDRMMEIAADSEHGEELIAKFAGDRAVGSVLLLHDLHPDDLETRVRRALAQPTLRGRGANSELIAIRDGAVHVRVEGGPAFETAVRHALNEAAPDAAEIRVELAGAHTSNGFVPLAQLIAG